MLPKLNIIFQNNMNVFFPGQTITGYVEVYLNKPLSCKALSIKVFGGAQVNFKDRGTVRTGPMSSQDDDISDLVDYFSNEEYYSITYKLWGDGITNNKLAAGRRQFPFSVVLPAHIPSSFESKFGFVKHTLDAWLDFILPVSRNVSLSTPISVIAGYDLNNDPLSLNPISLAKDKVLYNLMFKSGPISFTVNIDRSGYVPGENIIINALCSNKSNKEMMKSKAEVLQIIQYKAQGKTKTVENVVCFLEHPKLRAGGDNIWDSEPLLIPNLPPSHLPGCNIIDVKYMFVFKFVPSGLSITLEAMADLVIGTIPLHNTLYQTTASVHQANYLESQFHGPTLPSFMPFSDMSNSHIAPTYPGHTEGASAPPVGFDGSDIYPPFPPSYEESMRGSKSTITLEDFQYDFSDEDENLSSKPAYPNLKAN